MIKKILNIFFSYKHKRQRKKIVSCENTLNKAIKTENKCHRKYLQKQLYSTYWKKDREGSERFEYLIDNLIKYIDISKSRILCVGSRNLCEINYFKSKGAQDIVGIDLFSENKDILVMDMHNMEFPDNHFDIILSSHSFEHSRIPERVSSEFIRVVRNGGFIAIEVPVNYQISEIDLWDFKTLENLKGFFKPYIKRIFLEEYEIKTEKKKYTPMDVIKIIFSVDKNSMHEKTKTEQVRS